MVAKPSPASRSRQRRRSSHKLCRHQMPERRGGPVRRLDGAHPPPGASPTAEEPEPATPGSGSSLRRAAGGVATPVPASIVAPGACLGPRAAGLGSAAWHAEPETVSTRLSRECLPESGVDLLGGLLLHPDITRLTPPLQSFCNPNARSAMGFVGAPWETGP